MFAKAAEIDPLYARAYAGMANLRFAAAGLVSMRRSPTDDILAMADKALALDPILAEAHAARGVALGNSDRRDGGGRRLRAGAGN